MSKETMTREEILDLCGKAAREAQIRDDVCSRSTLIGLSQYFDIPKEMIRASMSLCGGAGASSGTCGTYTCGLLAVGLKYNVPLEDELANPDLQDIGAAKFQAFRDYYLEKMGTTMCPDSRRRYSDAPSSSPTPLTARSTGRSRITQLSAQMLLKRQPAPLLNSCLTTNNH